MVFKQEIISLVQESVWEWCKYVWYSNKAIYSDETTEFEKDVKMYGIQIKNSNSTKVIRLRKM